MQNNITQIKRFEAKTLRSGQALRLGLFEYFTCKAPLQFRLLDSPHWLKVDEAGVMQGVAPPVRHDCQFIVTVAALSRRDLLTANFLLNVTPETMLDSLATPMLALSLAHESRAIPQKPHNTRDVLIYIFGYYQNHPHGEQFISRLRNAANKRNQHLPDVVDAQAFVMFMEPLDVTERCELLEACAEKNVLEMAGLAVSAGHAPAASDVACEHSLLEHVYAYLLAAHPTALHHLMHAHPHPGHTFRHFKAVVEGENPGIEKKLAALTAQGSVLKKVKFTTPALMHFYVEHQLAAEKHTAEHIVYYLLTCEEALAMQALLSSMEIAVVQAYRARQAMSLVSPPHLHFFPHP